MKKKKHGMERPQDGTEGDRVGGTAIDFGPGGHHRPPSQACGSLLQEETDMETAMLVVER